jgi:hypothetical protein
MSKLVYLSDAVRQRIEEDARFEARISRKTSRDLMREADEAYRALGNWAIGILCRNGKPVFYAFINGVYTESRDLVALDLEVKGGAA